MRADVVKRRSSSALLNGEPIFRVGRIDGIDWSHRQVGTHFASVALLRIPTSYPGRCSFGDGAPEPSLEPAFCGCNVPEAGPHLSLSVFQPGRVAATRHPAQPRPRPASLEGAARSRDQTSFASVGTRPVSAKRQIAISSLRASATTIITLRMRHLEPAVRSSNHMLSTLSG